MATYRRRLTREKVLQALYAHELSNEPITGIMETILGELKPHREDFAFAVELVRTVLAHEEEIEGHIKTTVAHWEISRIAVVDRMLLRMGIAELLYFPDIPPKVTINESIEVAKNYSTEKSGKFVNGVLDAILEELKRKGKLTKTGRGLIDATVHAGEKPAGKKPTKTP
jgi:N utilization substance protein B